MNETEIIIEGVIFPRFSARGSVQTLSNIALPELRRTINGELIYLGKPSHHKYRSEVRCADLKNIGMNNHWIGSEVRVYCVTNLVERFGPDPLGRYLLSRAGRPESISVQDITGQWIDAKLQGGNQVLMDIKTTTLVSYQPILEMRIVEFSCTTQEWDAKESWHLILEEI